MMADCAGQQYKAFESLSEAKAADGVVVLEGDYGGQIYVVAPAEVVACSEQTLEQLLADVDGLVWKDLAGARVFFEAAEEGSVIPGGMGGGRVTKGIWIHEDLKKLGVASGIEDVLAGRGERLQR